MSNWKIICPPNAYYKYQYKVHKNRVILTNCYGTIWISKDEITKIDKETIIERIRSHEWTRIYFDIEANQTPLKVSRDRANKLIKDL